MDKPKQIKDKPLPRKEREILSRRINLLKFNETQKPKPLIDKPLEDWLD